MSASPAPAPAGKSQWSEYKNSEGRIYWSHAVTKQSVWEKPDELKSPFERAITRTQWKQYSSKGRPYYVHSVTKETKWDLPPELVELKKKVDAEEEYNAERERRHEQGLRSPTPPPGSPLANDNNQVALVESRSPSPSPEPLERIVMPPGGFPTHERAEEGFIYLLKREKIDETWTWDQTMRKIIMDPLYKALDTLAQKKAAFEKYTHGIVAERQAQKDARIAKLRPILHRLFSHSPYIKSYSTMKTASKYFANDKHWREAKADEQQLLLDEYTTELRRKEEAHERELRQRNMQVLGSLIRSLDISVATSWRQAHNIILDSPGFKADKDLQKIETIDILGVYDDYSRTLEQDHEEESRRLHTEHVRKGRKAREGFKALLKELEDKGELTRTSRWKDTVPKIKDDERYLALLGLQGSSPVDLWMDAVDDLGEEAEKAAEKIERALKEADKSVKLETTAEEFEELVKEVNLDSQVDVKVRKEVYGLIHSRLAAAAADEVRRAERKRRHRIDDLRYALKKVQRHIDLEMTYEEALPHMKDLPEFNDVTEEEDRKTAFDKFVKRQREKLREAESSDHASNRSHGGRRGSTNKMDVDENGRGDRAERGERDRGDRGDRERGDKGDRDRRSRRESSRERRHREERNKDRDYDKDRRGSKDYSRSKDPRDQRDQSERDRRYRDGSELEEREKKRPRVSSVDRETREKRQEKPNDEVEEGEI